VAYSRAGASGIYFAGLIERLGIATAVNAKAVVISAGFTAERLLTGEADLAVQQVSELKAVPGIEIAGRFPAGAQTFITLCAAAFTEAAEPDVARAFLGTLRSEGAVAAYAESGLEEVG
jgi:molybdate transport system substrate-binding protein